MDQHAQSPPTKRRRIDIDAERSTSDSPHQSNRIGSGSHNEQINANVVNIYKQREYDHRKIFNWLSAPDPTSNHDTARRLYEPLTCQWLLRRDQYERWKEERIQHLWLHGKPGCGKSVLCSTVIEDVQAHFKDDPEVMVTFYYFTFSDDSKQTYEGMLLSLVSQLVGNEHAKSQLEYHSQRGAKPSIQDMERILQSTAASLRSLVTVLDALDECPESNGSRAKLCKSLSTLLQTAPQLKLFVTSRHLQDITDFMETITITNIAVEPSDVQGDIELFAASQLAKDHRLRKFKDQAKDKVRNSVAERADGMFRWVYLLLEEMAKMKQRGPHAIEDALRRFPQELDEVYARILLDLDHDDRKAARTLLNWITYSQYPLTLEELSEALIVDPDLEVVHWEARGDADDVLRLLSSLVAVIQPGEYDRRHKLQAGAQVVRLAHFTVQEFLESSRIKDTTIGAFSLAHSAGHHFLTRSCISYVAAYLATELGHPLASNGDDSRTTNEGVSTQGATKSFTQEDLLTFPLLDYSVSHWFWHSSLHGCDDIRAELNILSAQNGKEEWFSIYNPDTYRWFYKANEYQAPTSLYQASSLSLNHVVRTLLGQGIDVNAVGGCYGTALQAAAVQDHQGIVSILLAAGADVNAVGGMCGTALQAAASAGDEGSVRVLLNAGADVNAVGGHYGTALQAAASAGDEGSVSVLLNAEADVNAAGGFYGTALIAAATAVRRQTETVQMLLDAGADINAVQGLYGTALTAAASMAKIETCRLLLDAGADVNAVGGYCGTALTAAATAGSGQPGIVQMLLNAGADVNVRGGRHGSALQAARYTGNSEIEELLLRHGACDLQRP